MSDTPVFDDDDRVDDIEAILRDLDADDVEVVEPPADVWAGIQATIRAEDGAAVTPLRSTKPAFSTRFLAAAAAIALVVAGVAIVGSIRDRGAEPAVASATLRFDADAFDPLGADAEAVAELVEQGDGYGIRIADARLPDDLGEPADLELWLIETDADGAIVDVASVAVIDGAGTYEVPDDIDVGSHRIVDISIEPRDGDDTHSSRSILRGSLDA